MKKLGLCVRYDCNNYGSMLQIYATQKAIENAGWTYEHIVYDKKTIFFFIKNIGRLFNPYFVRGKLMGIQKKRNMKVYPDITSENSKRLSIFKEYRKKYILPYSPKYIGYRNLKKCVSRYNAIMVGSDQLWTPAGLKSRFYNLLFVPTEVKKISFATSFGVTEIPKNQKSLTKKYLERIQFLSVRELSGAKIIKELTGRDSLVAVDPTLLFTGEQWANFFLSKRIIEKKYIFAYFLGTSVEHRKAVEQLSKETGYIVVTCPHMDEFVEYDINFGDSQRFDIGPEEFLNLIRYAEYICTDSFHGTIFSILNHKKFVTFFRYSDSIRKGKNTRIESLLNVLNLTDRSYKTTCDLFELINKPIDYDLVDIKLNILRDESMQFLNLALNGEDK